MKDLGHFKETSHAQKGATTPRRKKKERPFEKVR